MAFNELTNYLMIEPTNLKENELYRLVKVNWIHLVSWIINLLYIYLCMFVVFFA